MTTDPVHHKSLHEVVADDGNGRQFAALTLHPHPEAEAHVAVWVFVDGENGWGANHEVTLMQLKKTGDGTFQS